MKFNKRQGYKLSGRKLIALMVAAMMLASVFTIGAMFEDAEHETVEIAENPWLGGGNSRL